MLTKNELTSLFSCYDFRFIIGRKQLSEAGCHSPPLLEDLISISKYKEPKNDKIAIPITAVRCPRFRSIVLSAIRLATNASIRNTEATLRVMFLNDRAISSGHYMFQ